MAKINKPDLNVSAFASTSTGRKVFGEVTTSDELTDNYSATEFPRGWFGAVAAGGVPPQDWFESAHFVSSQHLAYLAQRGVPEWVATQEYYHPAIVSGSDNNFYQSVQDNTGQDPVGDGGINWVKLVSLNSVQEWSSQQYFATQTITVAGGFLDWDLDTEQVAVVTLGEDTTLNAPTNQKDGGQYRLLVIQDGVGGWALSFNGIYVPTVSGGDLPEIAVGANEYTLLNFDSDGTNMRVA